MLPTIWWRMTSGKKRITIHCLRLYWFTNHPIIRPLFIANLVLWLMPAHWLALPTAVGIGFSVEVFLRLIERILVQMI